MAKVHFIGIGGSGLSAIARLLLESGHTVTGSDRVLSPFAIDLQKAGATVYIGHHPRYVSGADWVVRSSAIPDDNPEVKAALAANIPVYKRADFLGQLMADKVGIAVAGTHGKTTTTAMIAWILSELKRNPSFIIGSSMKNLGVNAHAGKGNAFVIEAD
jgi:UDP-N-acetylmuramate--alanine ligase